MNVIGHTHIRVQNPSAPFAPVDEVSFLRWVQTVEGRYEWVEGSIMMMAGVSRNHANVALGIATFLRTHLNRAVFQVVSADFGVRTPIGIRYPDVMVDPAGRDGSELATDAPLFIAEVLSPSSIAIDMIEKAAEYRSIETLTAYAVFSQDEPRVWLWARGPEGWPASPAMIEGRGATLDLAGLKLALPLDAVY